MRLKIAALVFVLCQSIFAFDFGFVFSMTDKPNIGADLKFNQVYDLRPHLGMEISDNSNIVVIGAENNFYPSSIGPLEQFIGIDPTFTIDNDDNNSFFSFRTYYGLQYAFNDVISAFGEAGIKMDVASNSSNQNVFTTLSTGVGVIFYLVKGR
jgi:hypothetical protein